MTEINLLPWREARRRAEDRQILLSAIGIWVICGLVVFGTYRYMKSLQDNQNVRNNYLTSEIKKLDEKIKEINELRSKKDNLIARMEVIQNLQTERAQVVHIFDDIVRKLPDGVYFESMNKKDNTFQFRGIAQSNARVSDLMEKLDSSEWFSGPDLSVINIAPSQGVRLSQFDLKVSQQNKKPAQEGQQ